jgi:hypothetical protein
MMYNLDKSILLVKQSYRQHKFYTFTYKVNYDTNYEKNLFSIQKRLDCLPKKTIRL